MHDPAQPHHPTHIGSYAIEKELGRGGMGVVYLARDPRLGRPVAIKVLPAAFVADPSRLQRFEREARTLAALNHRNIAMIFGLEDDAGQRLLVLEFVPGQTLTQKLGRGALPLEEGLRLAIQICEGLEAAHERDVVHRDLKPDNVKVTPEGLVKVLDFGLATTRKTDDDATSSGSALTVAGMVMGTPGYMSPEQARGLPTDKRTDIWAFGCVLFELLSGYKAFGGETVSDCIAAILDKEPDFALIPPRTPGRLLELLHRCFVKDARRRLRDIGDARIELEDVLAQPQSGWFLPGPGQTARAGAVVRLVLPLGPEPGTTLAPALPALPPGPAPLPEFALCNALCRAISVSPDGSAVVFVAKSPRQLWLRRLDSTESRPIPGTLGAEGPVLADDGVRLAYFEGGRLRRISLAGGAPVALAPAPRPQGAAWDSATDLIYYIPDFGKPLMRVHASGSAPEAVASADKDAGEIALLTPEVLPGGRTVLVCAYSGDGFEHAVIHAVDTKSGTRRPLIQGGSSPRFLPSGHIVFSRGSSLLAVAFDADRLEIVGQPIAIEDHVLGHAQSGASHFSISEEGTLVFAPGIVCAESSALALAGRGVEAAGRAMQTDNKSVSAPAVGPDGRALVAQVLGSTDHLHLYDLDRPGAPGVKLTFRGDNTHPVFTPAGDQVVFRTTMNGRDEIAAMSVQMGGSEGVSSVYASDLAPAPCCTYTLAGKTMVAFVQTKPAAAASTSAAGGHEIWTVELGAPSSAKPLVQGPGSCWAASVSPDGRFVAFASDESGRPEVYIQPLSGGARRQVSTDGGTAPLWARSGGELYYRTDKAPSPTASGPDAAAGTATGPGVIAVRVAIEPSFMVGRPRGLYQGSIAPATRTSRQYDVVADGLLLVTRQLEDATRITRLSVVLNLSSELRKKAPPPARPGSSMSGIGGTIGAGRSSGFNSAAGVTGAGRTVSARVAAGPHGVAGVTSMPTIETPTPRQGTPSAPPTPKLWPKRSGEDPHESHTLG